MARYKGYIGYVKPEEVSPGIYEERATEVMCGGERLLGSRKWLPSQTLNDDILINERLSIICSHTLKENRGCIRYAVVDGVKWKVTAIESQYPRLILTLGGIYHG